MTQATILVVEKEGCNGVGLRRGICMQPLIEIPISNVPVFRSFTKKSFV